MNIRKLLIIICAINHGAWLHAAEETATSSTAAPQPAVILAFNDNATRELNAKKATMLRAIAGLIRDLPQSFWQSTNPIPLPGLSSADFDMLHLLMPSLYAIEGEQDNEARASQKATLENVLQQLTIAEQINLSKTADFLMIPLLIDLLAASMAQSLQQKELLEALRTNSQFREQLQDIPPLLARSVARNVLATHYAEIFSNVPVEDVINLAVHSWVSAVAFSPDGKLIASGSEVNAIRIWDIESRKYLSILIGHDSPVLSVAFSPDGKHIASRSDGHTVRIWDVKDGRLIKELKGNSRQALSVAWSLNDKYIASGSRDGTILIWDAENGTLLKALPGNGKKVLSVAWSPDYKYIASGSFDGMIRIWDAKDDTLLKIITGDDSKVLSVAWSFDGKFIASGSSDGKVHIWDMGPFLAAENSLPQITLPQALFIVITLNGKSWRDNADMVAIFNSLPESIQNIIPPEPLLTRFQKSIFGYIKSWHSKSSASSSTDTE